MIIDKVIFTFIIQNRVYIENNILLTTWTLFLKVFKRLKYIFKLSVSNVVSIRKIKVLKTIIIVIFLFITPVYEACIQGQLICHCELCCGEDFPCIASEECPTVFCEQEELICCRN